MSAGGHSQLLETHIRGPFHLQRQRWRISIIFYPSYALNSITRKSLVSFEVSPDQVRPTKENLSTFKSAGSGSSLHLQKPFPIAPSPTFDGITGRRCVSSRGPESCGWAKFFLPQCSSASSQPLCEFSSGHYNFQLSQRPAYLCQSFDWLQTCSFEMSCSVDSIFSQMEHFSTLPCPDISFFKLYVYSLLK